MSTKKLFISHADKDSKLVSDFVDLLYDIGLKEENMFCSSRTDIGVPIKEDIYEYLRNLLDSEDVIPIFMLSENYYESAACLNEMGAVWLKQKDYYTFMLPDFEFKQIKGAINPNKKAIKFDSDVVQLKGELTNFKNQICDIFHISISETRWEKQRNAFIEKIESISPEFKINLANCRAYCIGEVNYGGCQVNFDEILNKVSALYDFTKTKAEICSIVFFIGELDIYKKYIQNRYLSFSLKSNLSKARLVIELRLKSQDVQYDVLTNAEWENYSIPLKSFKCPEPEWHILREIKFLVYRNDIEKETIEIKDLKIT